VTLRLNGKEETREPVEIITQGESLLIRFLGIESPEAAALIKGAEIIADREFASPLKEGEFYVEDLKGLEVVNVKGETLGHILNIVEGGGGLLAELKLTSGGNVLVPFRNEFFGEVKLDSAKIVLLETWILDQ
jgi:16S rRNA processing protein RimM